MSESTDLPCMPFDRSIPDYKEITARLSFTSHIGFVIRSRCLSRRRVLKQDVQGFTPLNYHHFEHINFTPSCSMSLMCINDIIMYEHSSRINCCVVECMFHR